MDISGKLNGLDLFSGIGGIGQALGPWVKTRAYCERERFAQAILLSRMARGELDAAPIWDDVTTLTGHSLEIIGAAEIDIIFGGFPCQDISVAGAGAGLGEGTRSGLFREIVRLAGELRPSFVFLENVAAITIRGGGDVVGAFAELGYDCRWTTLSAADIGATHGRNRWWMLAHAPGRGFGKLRTTPGKTGQLEQLGGKGLADPEGIGIQGLWAGGREGAHPHAESELSGRGGDGVADTTGQRSRESGDKNSSGEIREGQSGCRGNRPPAPNDAEGWRKYLEANPTLEPAICGSPAWLQSRSNRIRALGNSVDVICAREAFKILTGLS